MGKLSGLLVFLLMINLIGYIILTDYVDDYPTTAGQAQSTLMNNNPLLNLYGTRTDNATGNKYYDVTTNSSLYTKAPVSAPAPLWEGVTTFIYPVFILFGFIQTIIAIAAFPLTLLTMIGLPWQLAMLLGAPLATLYILGIVDLFTGGGT